MSTFWLTVNGSDDQTATSSSEFLNYCNEENDNRVDFEVKKRCRIVDWTVDILGALLQEIDTRRTALGITRDPNWDGIGQRRSARRKNDVITEVEEIITLPEVDLDKEIGGRTKSTKLTNDVHDELRQYVQCIALMYRDNCKFLP